MHDRVRLTKQSLIAAGVSAYVAVFLLLAANLVWRFQFGGDARMCAQGPYYALCTAAEMGGAFLFTFLWAAYGTLIAIVFTAPPALVIGYFVPWLEPRFGARGLARVQYLSGALAGIAAGGLLAGSSDETLSLCATGAFSGLCGAFAFRRARYAGQPR